MRLKTQYLINWRDDDFKNLEFINPVIIYRINQCADDYFIILG